MRGGIFYGISSSGKVLIPNGRRNEIDRMFPTPSTPALIALDKDRRVLSRVLSRINLEAYLDEHLEKRKN